MAIMDAITKRVDKKKEALKKKFDIKGRIKDKLAPATGLLSDILGKEKKAKKKVFQASTKPRVTSRF